MSLEHVGTATTGVVFGLLDDHPGPQPPELAQAYKFTVHARTQGAPYQKVISGTKTNRGQNGAHLPTVKNRNMVASMDTIGISIFNGKVKIELHQCTNIADPIAANWTTTLVFEGAHVAKWNLPGNPPA